MANEQEQTQDIADRVTLGPHQHLIEATDEEERAGRWIVHRPTVRDEVRIGVKFAQLRTPAGTKDEPTPEPLFLDDQRHTLGFVLATLCVVIDKRPEWFPEDPGDCVDIDLIYELFHAYEAWRASFRRSLPEAGG